MALAEGLARLHVCLFGSAENFCGEPASVHVLTVAGTPTMGCPAHIELWAHQRFQDIHPIGPACGTPGAWWELTADGTPGYCTAGG